MAEPDPRSPRPEPREPDPARDPSPEPDGPSFEHFVRAYVEDPSLHFVLIPGIGMLATIAAWMVTNVVRQQSYAALALLLLLALGSFEGVRSERRSTRRFGPLTRLIAITWLLTAAIAAAGLYTGVL